MYGFLTKIEDGGHHLLVELLCASAVENDVYKFCCSYLWLILSYQVVLKFRIAAPVIFSCVYKSLSNSGPPTKAFH